MSRAWTPGLPISTDDVPFHNNISYSCFNYIISKGWPSVTLSDNISFSISMRPFTVLLAAVALVSAHCRPYNFPHQLHTKTFGQIPSQTLFTTVSFIIIRSMVTNHHSLTLRCCQRGKNCTSLAPLLSSYISCFRIGNTFVSPRITTPMDPYGESFSIRHYSWFVSCR